MPQQLSFSERHGLVRPKEIAFRGELPEKLRLPIIDILRHSGSSSFLWECIKRRFNPYGIDELPHLSTPIGVSKEEDDSQFIAAKRVLLACEWFRLYDLIEDIFGHMDFHDTELAAPDEEPQAYPFQCNLNAYLVHAGIGWQLVDGKMIARGDDAFERTVQTAEAELVSGGRTTAAERIGKAIRNLSVRPSPDFSGAISHATGAMECVFSDITGQHMTLGDYLKSFPSLVPGSLKKALDGLWGFASQEGARHGQEGVEPSLEEAEFLVAISAAVVTYLNRKHPRA